MKTHKAKNKSKGENLMKFNLKLLTVANAIIILLSLSACGNQTDTNAPSSPQSSASSSLESELKAFTKEELKSFDGKNGNPAYIAIEGKVYDVTNIPEWNAGKHQGFEAGNDLTNEMKNSPHGLSRLEMAKVVGILK